MNNEVTFINMPGIIEYKGHRGTIEIDFEENILHGSLIIPNVIDSYGGRTPQEFIDAFKEAVDDAIEDGLYKGEPDGEK